jgi:hypothetical protein
MTEHVVDITRRGKVVTANKKPTPREQQVRIWEAEEQIKYHGPGLTFGELAIGEAFTWPPPLPRGPGPITKTDATHYEFLIHGGRALDGQWPDGTPKKGYGTAEAFYRVERWT